MRHVYIALIVLLTAIVLIFKFQNLTSVTVSLLGMSATLPLSTLVILVFEAMDPRCPQVGRQAELVRSPDAPADAFVCLEDRNVIPIDREIPCRCQPRDASTIHQNLSGWGAHVRSLDKLHLASPRSRVAGTFSLLMGVKRETSFAANSYMHDDKADNKLGQDGGFRR